jgi:hypothetical protein
MSFNEIAVLATDQNGPEAAVAQVTRSMASYFGIAKMRSTNAWSRVKTASAPKPARNVIENADRVSEPANVPATNGLPEAC